MDRYTMDSIFAVILSSSIVIVGCLALFAFYGLIVQIIWNLVIVDAFNAPAIDYIHALGLMALSNILLSRNDFKVNRDNE